MTERDDAAPTVAANADACPWPNGYEMRAHGLYKIERDKHGQTKATHICGPLRVTAMARTDDGGAWSLVLRYADFDGRPKLKLLPRSSFIGDTLQPIRELMDDGLDVLAPTALAQVLHTMRPARRALVLGQPGWAGPNYVFGTEVFGPPSAEERIVLNGRAVSQPLGDLRGWQDSLARLAVGNSRMVLAICAAFAGPLLRPLKSEGFGVHLNGQSSAGKTTLLRVAASVTGQEVATWRATDNGLEAEAQAANDGLLILDELSEANPFQAGATVFMLANGKGKGRMDKTGAGRARALFLNVILSSGEIGLVQKMGETPRGLRPTAGQHVRLLHIPADAGRGYGVFEELHGHLKSAEFANAVGEATKSQRGSAMRAYLQAICAAPDEHLAWADEQRRHSHASLISGGVHGQAHRAAERFALLASAGELATRLGITPWPSGTALAASATLFAAWLEERGRGSQESRDAVEIVAGWLEAQITDGLGNIRGKTWQAIVRDEQCWCIGAETWRTEVCIGKDPAAIARALKERGLLVHDEGRLQAKARPGQGLGSGDPINVYAVRTRILTQDR